MSLLVTAAAQPKVSLHILKSDSPKKPKIEERAGFVSQPDQLIYSDKELEDLQTASDYRTKDEAIFNSISLPPGMIIARVECFISAFGFPLLKPR